MTRRQRTSTGQAFVGLVLLAIGTLLFADNLDLIDARAYWRYWPVLPLGLGLVKLVFGGSRGDRVFGVVLTIFGGGHMARILGYWSPGPTDVAAFVLIGVGLFFVTRGLFGQGDEERRVDASDRVSAFAVLGGFERSNNSPDFKGGSLTAVMGGCELDLRHADLRAPASIDVFAMWGGVEMRVPEDWTVELRGMPLLGAFVDKTRPPAIASDKRLVIRGMAFMGGVEIKN